MTDDDKAIIRRYAAGNDLLRDRAIQIYRSELTSRIVRSLSESLPEEDDYMLFMAEVDNACPDYGLRAMYRKRILCDNATT